MDTNGNLFVCKLKIDLIFYHANNNNLTTNTTKQILLKMQSQNETTSSAYEICAICLEEVKRDLFTTKCGHQFHYGCIHKCDMSHRGKFYDPEELEELFGNYSYYKRMIDINDNDSPLSCPLCRSPIKSIREEKQVMSKNQISLSVAQDVKIINPRHNWTLTHYDEPMLKNKFQSQKRNTNSKLRFRRFNK